jgi:DNA repair exonuclease SbcCD ATPase subunit
MFRFDELTDVFNCSYCKNQFVEPVILPCYESICDRDLNKLLNMHNKFICPFCDNEHSKPENGFQSDKKLKRLLDLELNKLNFDLILPNFSECKKDLKYLDEKINDIEMISNDATHYIYCYFERIINQVDLQREQLKEAIDIHSEDLIQHIKSIRQECKIFDINIEQISKDLKAFKKNFNQLSLKFNTVNIDETKIKEIIENSNILKPQVINKLNEFQSILLANKSFEFKSTPIDASSFFGKFYEVF